MKLIALVDKKRRECFFISSNYDKFKNPMMVNLLRTYIFAHYPHKYKVEVLEKGSKKITGYYTEFLTNNRTREIIRTSLGYIGG